MAKVWEALEFGVRKVSQQRAVQSTKPLFTAENAECMEPFIPSNFHPFREQIYSKLLEEHSTKGKKEEEEKHFVDPYFPNDLYDKEFVWRRIVEIDPQFLFFADRPSGWRIREHFTLVQGTFQAHWFHVALTLVAQQSELLNWLIPELSAQNKIKCGVYRFHFWHGGNLREVVVDDYLPFKRSGEKLLPVFVKSAYNEHEYWCSLVEKAYVKLHGSYQFLMNGHSEQAFADLTGGMPQSVRLNLATILNPFILFREMQDWIKAKAVLSASVKFRDRIGEVLDTDLITGLAYAVLDVRRSSEGTEYICLQPPDPNHSFIHAIDRAKLNLPTLGQLRNKPRDRFWMHYDEFLQNFHYLIAVHLIQQQGSAPAFYRYKQSALFSTVTTAATNENELITSRISLTHLCGVFVRPCHGWGDWLGLCNQRQFGFRVKHSENRILVHLVQESLPLQPITNLSLLVVQAENGRKHRVHNFKDNDCLMPKYDVEIAQYGGCFSAVLGKGSYILIPYCRSDTDCQIEFQPRKFSLRAAITNHNGIRHLNDSAKSQWSTITKLSVSDFTFQIPTKREQLHELEFLN